MKNLFITGFWRSGTSLLLRLFDGNPNIFSMPIETGMITILEKNPKYLKKLKSCKNKFELLAEISSNQIIRFQDIINASINGISFSNSKTHYSFDFDFDLFSEDFFKYLQNETNISKIIFGYYKSIRNAWKNCNYKNNQKCFSIQRAHRINKYPTEDSVRFVNENINDMNVLEIIRDPIYQISSALRCDVNLKLEDAIVAWGYCYNYIKKRSEKYASRYKLIKYEDLILNTEKVMRDVSSFIGMKFSKNLLHPTFNNGTWKSNSKFQESSKLVLRKKTYLTSNQVADIKKSLGDYRKELGYS